jgi:hypothetical protein
MILPHIIRFCASIQLYCWNIIIFVLINESDSILDGISNPNISPSNLWETSFRWIILQKMAMHSLPNLILRGGDKSARTNHVRTVEPFSDDFSEEVDRYEAALDESETRTSKRPRFGPIPTADDDLSNKNDNARHANPTHTANTRRAIHMDVIRSFPHEYAIQG